MFQVQIYPPHVWIISSNPPFFLSFWPSDQSCVRKTLIFFFFSSSARLKMQTRCWDVCLVSSAAGSFSGGRVETELLPGLENFKSPSEKKTGQKQRSGLCWGQWASSSVAMKPSAMFTFTSSEFGSRKGRKSTSWPGRPSSGWIWTCSSAAVRLHLYVHLEARVDQREDAETAVYVSRVTSHQRSRKDWNKITEEKNTTQMRRKW